jgi:hypothetical protein
VGTKTLFAIFCVSKNRRNEMVVGLPTMATHWVKQLSLHHQTFMSGKKKDLDNILSCLETNLTLRLNILRLAQKNISTVILRKEVL